jgi:outer membrane protein TolC
VLPTLRVVASTSAQGLNGTPNPNAEGVPPPDAYYIGDWGTSVSQIFRRNFPSQSVRAVYNANFKNRLAQADYGIEQLQLRQNELRTKTDVNQVAVDLSNETVALQQAHTRYQATLQSRVLEEQLVDAEEKKYSLGTSTTFALIQVQRDLATAKSNEIAAIAQYANAKISLERVLGTTLETYQISLSEATAGKVSRPSGIPDKIPEQ